MRTNTLGLSIRRAAALLVVLAAGVAPSVVAQSTPTLTVDAAGNPHPINPDIYGIANYGLDPAFAQEVQIPNIRWGGDATTRYNWQVDSSNAGFDWYFMGGNGETTVTPSGSADTMISTFQAASNAKTLLTIPIIPYVNKMAAWNCSFPVSVYGPQQSTNPYVHPNGDSCGNSISTNGTQLLDTNIYANHIDNTVALQQGWVQHLISTFGTAAKGGVPYYQLDNEPGGWSNTHRDVEPVQPDYNTIISLGQQYAAMIKQMDPSAKVFGPVDFTLGGWIGTPSGQDGLFAGQYYLQQMAAYETANNQRILDYFDEHYYGGGSTAAAELESTRALWDPTFNSGSWVEQWYFDGPMQLLPRFQSWIQTYYPGTKLSISEYSFASGTDPLVDMLTESDVLGIYGRQSLDFANMWNVPKPTDPIAYSFRIYRNYDGAGGQFGNTSVNSTSTDQSQLSVYGALRSSDGALTVVAINKTTGAIQTSLTLANFSPAATAAVYTYSNANLNQIVTGTPVAVVSNAVTYTFPAYSVTEFVFTPLPLGLAVTTTSLSASSLQLIASQSVKFTATIAPQSGSGTPTGTVTFSDGTTPLGTVPVTSGTATFSTSSLSNGTHTVTAAYSGDSNFSPSTSPVVTVVVSAPSKITTTTSVSASATQLTVGQTLSLNIVVAPQSGTGTPTGSVTILDGTTQLGAPSLTVGAATFSTSALAVGTHSITVSYSGDSNFATSTSAVLSVVVSAPAKVNTSTSVSASSTQIIVGSSVTFSAKVAVASGTATPTGTITFLDSGTSVGMATLSGGSAQISLTALATGTHSISAAYSGDTNYNPSTSAVATVTVEPAPAADYSLSLSSSALSVTAGGSGKLSLSVTPENGFKQAVSFACSGLPASASCSFSPQSVTPSSGPVTTALTVQVPQAKMAALSTEPEAHRSDAARTFVAGRDIGALGTPLAALPIFAIVIASIPAIFKKQALWRYRFMHLRPLPASFAAMALATVLILGGCASVHTAPITGPIQTYTITVTASGTNSPTHSQSFTLTVQP
jgi:Glycoside hydrolase family 44/Bacterial Ig-like domain (group 3)